LLGREVLVLHVYDQSEADPTLQGTIELRDRESGTTMIKSITPAVRQLYARQFQERATAIQTRLAAGSIGYLAAPTTVAPIVFGAGVRRQEGVVSQSWGGRAASGGTGPL